MIVIVIVIVMLIVIVSIVIVIVITIRIGPLQAGAALPAGAGGAPRRNVLYNMI